MKYYTFSTLGKDGLKWYPKSTKNGFQGNWISDWTNNKAEAILWTDPNDFDCLMNEYDNTKVEEVIKNFITITNVNNQHKFMSFKIDGLEDGISIGLDYDVDGFVINYKGEQVSVPFLCNSKMINKINFPEFNDNLLEEFDKEFFENGQYDDDVGDWRENTVFIEEIDQEKVNACKEIFKDIDKIKIKCEGENIPNNEIHGFLQVIDECNLYNAEEYSLFMSVINEHCIEKGIYDLETIKNTWFTFKRSLEDAAKNIDVRKKEFEEKIKNQGTDNV